jgi:hypothetical protein
MKFQIGDQVKFLDAVGGGVVTRILSSKMVCVADQDGFEIPTLISELVKVDPSEAGARFFTEEFPIPDIPHQEKNPGENGDAEENASEPDSIDPAVIRNRKSEDIFLAFIPHDQKWLITGLVDVYLINNTSFDIIYNLFHRSEKKSGFTGVDYGSLFAGTLHLLDTVSRESLSHWTEGSIQFLFHKEDLDEVIPPFNSEFRIEGTKFQKEGAYRDSPYVNEKGIVIKVVSLSSYILERSAKSKLQPLAISPSIETGENEKKPVIFKHQTEPRRALVDLHIHELIEDPSNLQKGEILEFQKNYFIKCLDAAIGNNFMNVVFIHGVGNGTLRQVLTDHLKKTGGIEWFDAPMALYGVGAIEVRIPHNQ